MKVNVPGAGDHASRLRAWLAEHIDELKPWRRRVPGDMAGTIDQERSLLRLLADAGWSRWGWPVDAGGLGGDETHRAILYDELAFAGLEVPEAYVILETLGPVLVHYAPQLAVRHLRDYLDGREMWGQGFSEPEAGSDLAALRTTATPTEDGFVLEGEKIWTTLGQFAGYAAVLARTGGPGSGRKGLSLLWVDLRQPGVRVAPIRAANGRDEFAEMHFGRIHVPSDGLIGREGDGWTVAMYLLQYERGMYAWLRQAVLHRRLREIAAEAGEGPGNRAALGSGYLAASALRARCGRTVHRLAAGETPGPDVSIDKILLSRAEQATFDAARRRSGARMLTDDDGETIALREEWFYSRASSIFGGAVDVQRDLVSEYVLGLPRERRA